MISFMRTQRNSVVYACLGVITVLLGASIVLLILRRDLVTSIAADPVSMLTHLNGGRALARFILLSIAGLIGVVALVWPRQAWRVLTTFFRAEAHPLNLAIFRIVLFAFLLTLVNLQELVFYSSLPSSLLVAPRGMGWLHHVVPFTATTVTVAVLVFRCFCVLAIIGLFSRFSALMVVVCGLYVLGVPQFFGKVNHYHHLMWFAGLLAVSRSGDALSVDALISAWRRATKGSIEPPGPSRGYALPLRFVWLLIGIAYFFPGFWKFWTSGFDWIMTDNLRYQMYAKWVELDGWVPFFRIDHYPSLYHLSALATIVFEIGFIFFVLFPRVRPLFAVGGLAFHTMTGLFMRISFLPLQVCYVAFFNWYSIFQRVGRWLFPGMLYVVYDGNCTLCRRTIGSLRVFDLFGRITYVNALDAAALRANKLEWLDETATLTDMHVVGDGAIPTGYNAYRALAWRIPVLWPTLPFLGLAPVEALGTRIYRRVADSRVCRVNHPPQKAAPRPQQRFIVYAIAVVGVLLIVPNLFFGANRTMSAWPFACYPTFDSIKGPTMNGLMIETQDASGTQLVLEPYPLHETMSSERWQGLVRNVLNAKADDQARRLTALWQVVAQQSPAFANTRTVRFYKVTISTIPEERARPPLEQELLAELTV